jgi:hypothetical protein
MSSKAQFWLTNNAGTDRMQIPVLPAEIEVSHGASNEKLSVAGLGEITIIQDREAIHYKWSCHFPAVWHQGCCVDKPLNPLAYRDKIEEWMATPKPIKFIATGCGINKFCTIESFDYKEKGGDPDTLHYTIELKEYQEIIVRQVDTTPVVETPMDAVQTEDTALKQEEAKSGKVKTRGSRLMLRASTSTSSEILKRMPNGSALKILSQVGSWYKVEYDGTVGYAYGSYVQVQ